MADYNPSTDYAASYDALSKRIQANFAAQRGRLNQELATAGVQTSGVRAIPSAALRSAEAGEMNDVAGQFALEQARTGIEDRRSLEAFGREKELAELGWNRQDAVSRRAAKSGLEAALISGGLGAVGSAAGPGGYFAGRTAAKAVV